MSTDQTARVWLIGESNPYQSGPAPEFDLYPSPPQSAGARLCRILGYDPDTYVATFERRNLLYGRKWSVRGAKDAAHALLMEAGDRDAFVLLGAKVCAAFGVFFVPLGHAALVREPRPAVAVLRIPHPSGLSRGWHDPTMAPRVREAVAKLVEERGGIRTAERVADGPMLGAATDDDEDDGRPDFANDATRAAVRRWLNKFAQVLMLAAGEEASEQRRIDAYRCSHEMRCGDCFQPYWRHADDPFAPWLTVLCDGRRVKL